MMRSPARRLALLALLVASSAAAQTDYHDTDARRPLLTEDASPVERHAFELLFAPITFERRDDGTYVWSVTPEITYGILPRTHVELATSIAWRDPGAIGEKGGLAGAELSVLHQLQLERAHSPALAVAASLVAPVGGLASDEWFGTIRGIATRAFPLARVHLNGAYTVGPARRATGIDEPSRWQVSASVDRALSLRSVLLAAEVVASRPLVSTGGDVHPGGPGVPPRDVAWRVGAGARWQRTPRLTMDAGIARTVSGPHRGWHLTFGMARASVCVRSSVYASARPPRREGGRRRTSRCTCRHGTIGASGTASSRRIACSTRSTTDMRSSTRRC